MRFLQTLAGCLAAVMLCATVASAAGPSNVDAHTATYHAVWQHVAKHYRCGDIRGWSAYEHKYDGKLTSQDALRFALHDMLSAVGDSRVKVLTPNEGFSHIARTAGGYAGVGLSVEPRYFITDKIVIKSVLEDSTAEEAGVAAGDEIESVNGVKLAGIAMDKVSDVLRGQPGTVCKLQGTRNGKALEIAVKRDLDGSLGLEFSVPNPTKLFHVRWVMHDSPAEKANIKEGDLIAFVDGYGAHQLDEADIRDRLRWGPMGSTVTVTLHKAGGDVDVKIVRGVVPDWGIFIGMRSQNYLEFGWGSKTRGRTGVELKSLEWQGITSMIDRWMEDMNAHDASILDLRGCDGEPDVAARVAARFIESGEVIRYSTRDGDVHSETVYTIGSDRVLRRTVTVTSAQGSSTSSSDVETVGPLYQHKLVVLIDGRTRGGAAALAHALKRSKRGVLVGSATASDNIVCRTETFSTDTEKVLVQLPVIQLLNDAGQPLGGVRPDRSVWFGDALKEAQKEVAGVHWHNDPEFITIAVCVLVLGGIVGLCWLCGRRKGNNEGADNSPSSQVKSEPVSPCPDKPATGGGDTGCCGGDDELEAAETPGDIDPAGKSAEQKDAKDDQGGRGGILPIVMLGVVALAIGGMFFMNWKSRQAPSGARAEVIVEFYTDGSAACADQAAVVERLKREYDGPIRFETIDIRQQPFLTPETPGEKTDSVNRVPMIRVRYHWVDASGKSIASGWQSGGASTKRDLVRQIETAEQNLNSQYPCSEKIVRHRGRK